MNTISKMQNRKNFYGHYNDFEFKHLELECHNCYF